MGTVEEAIKNSNFTLEYQKLVNEAKREFLKEEFLKEEDLITSCSLSDIIDQAASLKKESDVAGKRLETYKKFFKKIGTTGETFQGSSGNYVSLMGRAVSTVEPKDLKDMLESVGREEEFMSTITVKVADARKKLGTMLFDKIATTTPNASISVKIGSK